MEIILSIITSMLAIYLSGVNALAIQIDNALPSLETLGHFKSHQPHRVRVPGTHIAQNTEQVAELVRTSGAYQSASVIASETSEPKTASVLDALVNVYCEHTANDQTKVTTGTGFFIDESGIILTNAHVAHFLLLDEIIGDTNCFIRTGNPATVAYKAELLYISPLWVRENAEVFTEANPTGTGERDFALLYVTDSAADTDLPESFPALRFSSQLLRTSFTNDEVVLAGYPAEELSASRGRAPLVPKMATTTVARLMTFGSNFADVFSIRGTEVGERGASGGPVLLPNGTVVGLISTRGNDAAFGAGALRAITISYIDRTITEETGYSLRQNLAGDIPYRANIFNATMVPFLRLLLTQALD